MVSWTRAGRSILPVPRSSPKQDWVSVSLAQVGEAFIAAISRLPILTSVSSYAAETLNEQLGSLGGSDRQRLEIEAELFEIRRELAPLRSRTF